MPITSPSSGGKKAMTENGRSLAHIKRMFTTLRILVSYGVAIKDRDSRELAPDLAELRV